MDVGYILSHNWKNLKSSFANLKVHRMTAHYLPNAGMTDRGMYLFAFFDDNKNYAYSYGVDWFDVFVGTVVARNCCA